MFNKYPYTDFHELNLDWVIAEVQKINASIDSLIDINTIKYADPIEWNISKQYEKNTIVINNYNTYLSKLPVPAGIPIDNGDYWLLIGNFNIPLREVNERVDNVEVSIAETDARVDDVDTDIVGLKEKDVHIENMIAGTWSSTITYAAGTYVTYLDSMYKCKIQNIGIVPTNTTYWEIVTVNSELVNFKSITNVLENEIARRAISNISSFEVTKNASGRVYSLYFYDDSSKNSGISFSIEVDTSGHWFLLVHSKSLTDPSWRQVAYTQLTNV